MEDADDAFTCTLADPACWATKIKNFPCSADDKTCLNDLLPDDIPCNFGETCWNNPNLSGSRAWDYQYDQFCCKILYFVILLKIGKKLIVYRNIKNRVKIFNFVSLFTFTINDIF